MTVFIPVLGLPAAALGPKPMSDGDRIEIALLPPTKLVSGIMKLPVMQGAEGHGIFVRDFPAHGGRLGELEVMGLGRLPSADEAGVVGNEAEVAGVAEASGSGTERTALSMRPVEWEAGAGREADGGEGATASTPATLAASSASRTEWPESRRPVREWQGADLRPLRPPRIASTIAGLG